MEFEKFQDHGSTEEIINYRNTEILFSSTIFQESYLYHLLAMCYYFEFHNDISSFQFWILLQYHLIGNFIEICSMIKYFILRKAMSNRSYLYNLNL